MKNIVVPTDFSDYALDALKVAASIASRTNAQLHLVHAYDSPTPKMWKGREHENGFTNLQDVKESINEQMTQLFNNRFLDGINTVQHVCTGKKLWQVLKLDDIRDADLIVMGSHGSSGLHEFFIGSNTQKIVRLADCPVLVIKEPIENFTAENIVFASNFIAESIPNFRYLKAFTEIFNSKIHLLKIITPANFEKSEESYRAMEKFVQEVGLKNFTLNVYNDRSIEKGIFTFCEKNDVDLIAIETHGRSGWSNIAKSSLAEHIVNHSDLPILSTKIDVPQLELGDLYPESLIY